MSTEILKKAISTYGKESQIDVCIEEMSELIKAIIKFKRASQKIDAMEVRAFRQYISEKVADIAEEIADVEIMLQQLRLIFNCEKEVNGQLEYKINRLKERLMDNGNIS